MAIEKWLIQWNVGVCTCLGLFFNSLLLWLVLRRAPKEMRDYCRILMQTCATDLALLLCSAVLQPFCCVFDEVFNICQLYGPWMPGIPQLWKSVGMAIWVTFYYFTIIGFSVQFLFRYLTLNKSMQITFPKYLLMLMVPAVLCAIFPTWSFLADLFYRVTFSAEQTAELLSMLDIDEPGGQHLELVWSTKAELWVSTIYFLCFLTINITSYTLIVFCGYKMIKFVRQNVMPEKLRQLNRQLTRSLMIMALFPLLVSMHNAFGGLIGGTFVKPTPLVLTFNALPPLWLPVLNPVVSILTIRPFRETILAIFCRRKPSAEVKVTPVV